MKKLLPFLIVILATIPFLIGAEGETPGCSFNMDNDFYGYFAGKGFGVSINKFVPEADPELTSNWKALMQKYSGQESVPGTEIQAFYNQSVLIITGYADPGDDPYGIIGDLTFIFSRYGGKIVDGKLIEMGDVPMPFMFAFQQGYANGRRVATR